MVSEQALEADPPLFVAVTVKLKVPALCGSPETTPAGDRDKGLPSAPPVRDQTMGPVPVAVSAVE